MLTSASDTQKKPRIVATLKVLSETQTHSMMSQRDPHRPVRPPAKVAWSRRPVLLCVTRRKGLYCHENL